MPTTSMYMHMYTYNIYKTVNGSSIDINGLAIPAIFLVLNSITTTNRLHCAIISLAIALVCHTRKKNRKKI